jgi:amidophosphoribosyltransferase
MSKAELSPPEQAGPQEACGVTAVFSKTETVVSPSIPFMQSRLHHRGRDSAGIAAFDHSTRTIVIYKGIGSVRDVFRGRIVNEELETEFDFASFNLLSAAAIGHNRYGTSGDEDKDSSEAAQPMLANWEDRRLAVAFNGNIPEIERRLLKNRIPDSMPESGNFDTNDIAEAIVSAPGASWEERIKNGMEGVMGAYSITALTDTGEVFGLRGPSGTWPLWVGESADRIVFGSESIIDDADDIVWSEVHAGELVKATLRGVERTQVFTPLAEVTRCALHDVYGAKPESLMSEEVRYRMFRAMVGRTLASEYPVEADVYAGVPNTGLNIAEGYIEALGVSLTPVFETLKDSERSYNSQNPEAAFEIIKGKFKLRDPELVRGKSIALIEDSIIKGSTMGGDPETQRKGIIQHLRDAGAAEVHMLLGLPEFVDECDQGYVVRKDLLAALKQEANGEYRQLTPEAIARNLGADSAGYISIEGLKSVYREVYNGRETACTSCFGGPHPLRTPCIQSEQSVQDLIQSTVPLFIDKVPRVGRMVTVGD